MKKDLRIRKNIEYKRVYKYGKNYWNRNLILYVKKNKSDKTRVGFTITKKIGNSVTRNKVRRRMKEIYRLKLKDIKMGFDLVFIPKKNVVSMPYNELENSMIHIMKIAGVLKKVNYND